jgi:aminoglycoside phosphotransferase (APT) family kinase protein
VNADSHPPEYDELVQRLAPGGRVVAVSALPGSFSNRSERVDVESSDGQPRAIVVRRYAEASEPPATKAVREYAALSRLRDHSGVPAPDPLLLDADGSVLGSPGIVTSFVDGDLVLAHPGSTQWERRCATAASVLAGIHSIAVEPERDTFLMDAAVEALWFAAGDEPPGFMAAHSDGSAVWRAVTARRATVTGDSPTLVHVDYWSGNILWQGDRIAAVVDWEEAGFGPPGLDVGYCLMELYLEGMDTAADEFVAAYERASGRPVADLALWKLAASARPMLDIDAWLTTPPMADRFRRFIAGALDEL